MAFSKKFFSIPVQFQAWDVKIKAERANVWDIHDPLEMPAGLKNQILKEEGYICQLWQQAFYT